MTQTIYASFANIADAEKATGALMDFGMKPENISLVAHEDHAGRIEHYQSHDAGRSDDHAAQYVLDSADEEALSAKTGISTTTANDAAAGAAKGTGVGLGLGVALALAAMFIPGIGLVVGGGTLALALGGAAATVGAGAIAGGVVGYLKDQGIPEQAISTYQQTYESGGAILAVTRPDTVSVAAVEEILAKYNATNIHEYSLSVVG